MGGRAMCFMYTLIDRVSLIFPNIIVNLTVWILECSRELEKLYWFVRRTELAESLLLVCLNEVSRKEKEKGPL